MVFFAVGVRDCNQISLQVIIKYLELCEYVRNVKIKGKLNPLSANPTKWSNTLKQFVGNSR